MPADFKDTLMKTRYLRVPYQLFQATCTRTESTRSVSLFAFLLPAALLPNPGAFSYNPQHRGNREHSEQH